MIKSFQGEFRWLSNFVDCEVMLSGMLFPSVENAYAASKTLSRATRQHFQECTAGQAKRKGRKVAIRDDWDDVKLLIMESLLWQKFEKEPFKSQLIATGQHTIMEGNTWGDTFWGVCNGEGDNHLGKLLMNIRNELQMGEEDEVSGDSVS